MNPRYFGSKRILPVKKINQISGNGCFEFNYTIFRTVRTHSNRPFAKNQTYMRTYLKTIKIRIGGAVTHAVRRWPVTTELGFDSRRVHVA
jgi:hypothetical protein